ncbi:MAG: RHS repeat-associated core domain-containing protein [Verrucomicrobiota bacterium]
MILAAVMGGEARAVVVTGRAEVSERVGRAETVEKECASFPGATRGMVREAEVAGLEDAGPLGLWFPGGVAVARSDGLSGTGTTGCRRVRSTSWRYDLADNRVARTETEERRVVNSTSWVRTAAADQRCLYRNAAGTGPNGRNQLSQSWETRTRWDAESGAPLELSEQTVSYRYDPRGNRTRRTTRLWKQARTTGSAAWPVPAVTDTDEALEWDGENRLTGMWRGPWREELAQVPFESLVGEAVAGSTVWRWGYDHRSRRVQRDEPGSGGERLRTVTVFSGGTSAAEYTETAAAGSAAGSAWTVPSAATVQHVRGPDLGGGTKGLLYALRNGLPKFNRYNGRGDVVAQSDIDGTTTWAASYQADGRRTAEAGTNVERHRANTKEEDPTGLLNEGFRYRDMETGTFISRDPLGHVDGPNVYCYVGQNPWSKFDPDGLTGWAIPPQYAESAEYREGFRKGMAGGAKLGLALTAGVVATVVAAPVIAAGATAAGVSGGTATAATVLGSGAAGGYAGNAISNALNDRPVNENWKTATATGALLYGAAHVVGTSVQAFKAGLNSVKSTAPSVGGTAAQTTAEVAAAAKTPASFFQSTRIEVEALQTQGLSRSEAFAQIRSFNAGNADGYLFHFTNPTNGRAIVNSGELWATQRGLGGAGVYTGTTPTPNFFQRYFSPVGWGVNPGSGVRIPLRVTPELESITRTPFLPRWTRIVGDGQSIPLSAP